MLQKITLIWLKSQNDKKKEYIENRGERRQKKSKRTKKSKETHYGKYKVKKEMEWDDTGPINIIKPHSPLIKHL